MCIQVSSFLFHRTSPARLLTPDDVMAMMSDWSNQLVVTGACLPRPMIEVGLLDLGSLMLHMGHVLMWDVMALLRLYFVGCFFGL